MKINLIGNVSNLLSGVEELREDFDFTLGEGGFPLTIQQNEGTDLEVSVENGQGKITYGETAHFFRAFSLFLEHIEKEATFHLKETLQFETVGPMFDLSRNAVMKVENFKGMFRKLAVMGFNTTMLYMEDTYEVKSEPYFGYMRGRYSQGELKVLDDYAHQFGIECIPCIQTLAHLEEFLKWSDAAHLKDTRGALLLESEATNDFVREMIESVTTPFRSKRIHIGMDEAEELGRGIYLNKFGFKDRLELMTGHLKEVLKVVDDNGLEAMMWSDMFIKLASDTGDSHYDLSTEIPEEMIDATPENVQLMYWDYAHTKKEEYLEMMQKHKAFGRTPAFAGGIWVWNTFATNYGLSLQASDAALQACKQEEIQDVFVTLWGDDGYENNFYSSLLGLQMYAEHAYARELDRDKLRSRVKFCTGIDEQTFLNLNDLDAIPGVDPDNMEQTNPSKFLLWQDVLLGLFDKHVEGLESELYTHYTALEKTIRESRNPNNSLDYIFEVPEKLAALLSVKAGVGVQLKAAYDARNIDALKNIQTVVLPDVVKKAKALREAHRDQWLKMHKPFGWEVLDIRYGGLLSRLDTAIHRINDFILGNVDMIDELEQERLYFHDIEGKTHLGWCSYYFRIASPNVFFHVLPIY